MPRYGVFTAHRNLSVIFGSEIPGQVKGGKIRNQVHSLTAATFMVIQARTTLSCFIESLLFTYQTVSAAKQDNSDSNSRKLLKKIHVYVIHSLFTLSNNALNQGFTF